MDSNITNRDEIIKIILDSTSIDLKDKEILSLLRSNQITENINSSHENSLSKGDIMSDRLAAYAGSWKFIITFMLVLVTWIIINIIMLGKSFDPYPFILLNLVLSCTAAIQAPILMMSQNRQESKDRIRSENDYIVNLKAEVLAEDLYKKINELIANQEMILKKIDNIDNK
ncbi:MAG: DUF1003 domain-containing protein [Gudongella sp.]|nr:DUF1003 domain-containing protein [Gudongella sp.]